MGLPPRSGIKFEGKIIFHGRRIHLRWRDISNRTWLAERFLLMEKYNPSAPLNKYATYQRPLDFPETMHGGMSIKRMFAEEINKIMYTYIHYKTPNNMTRMLGRTGQHSTVERASAASSHVCTVSASSLENQHSLTSSSSSFHMTLCQ